MILPLLFLDTRVYALTPDSYSIVMYKRNRVKRRTLTEKPITKGMSKPTHLDTSSLKSAIRARCPIKSNR